jgi:uncharacterized membrane protein YraQ (UPF0718 family)
VRTLNIVIYAIAAALAVIGYFQGEDRHILGIREGVRMLLVSLLPLLGALLVAGYIRVLLPESVIRAWLGEESGYKGILAGYVAGTVTVGGPFISFPIAASLYHAGASVTTVTTYITAWALWGGGIIFYELSILGPRLFTIRIIASILFPITAGAVAAFLARIV